MPPSRRRGIRRRQKRFSDFEVQFLRTGFSLGGRSKWEDMRTQTFSTEVIELADGTTREISVAHTEFTAEAIDQMREAYEVLRDEVNDGYADERPGCRPFAWWLFDSPEPRDERLEEVAQLDRMRLLPEGEVEHLRHTAHGVRNVYHATPFRRKWAWWRFLSERPWQWDGPSETEQLVAQPAALTDRENTIWRSKYDSQHADHFRLMELTDDELLFLGVELVEPVHKHGCRPIDPSLRK